LLPTTSTNKNDGRIPKIPEVPGAPSHHGDFSNN